MISGIVLVSCLEFTDCRYFRNGFSRNYLTAYSHINAVFFISRKMTEEVTNWSTWDNLVQERQHIRWKLAKDFNMDWLELFFNSFCTRLCLKLLWWEISREAILNFLPKSLSGETLCKFLQIFPPKDLVYRGNIFLHTF